MHLDFKFTRTAESAKPVGLGTMTKRAIHATLDVLPMPKTIRATIKGCGGCAKRAAAMDRAIPDIRHPFSQI